MKTDDTGIQHTRLGIEGVDSGVDTKLSNTTGQDSSSVQVSEGRGWGRIRQIVSRHIHSLDGSNGAFLCRGDTFLPVQNLIDCINDA